MQLIHLIIVCLLGFAAARVTPRTELSLSTPTLPHELGELGESQMVEAPELEEPADSVWCERLCQTYNPLFEFNTTELCGRVQDEFDWTTMDAK